MCGLCGFHGLYEVCVVCGVHILCGAYWLYGLYGLCEFYGLSELYEFLDVRGVCIFYKV